MFQSYLAYLFYKIEEFFVIPFLEFYMNINQNIPICIKEYDMKSMQVYTIYKPWILTRIIFGKYMCPAVSCSKEDIVTSIEYVNGTHKLIKNSFEEKIEHEHYVYISLDGFDISRYFNRYNKSFTRSNGLTFKDFICILFLQNNLHVKTLYTSLAEENVTLKFISSNVEEKTFNINDILQ